MITDTCRCGAVFRVDADPSGLASYRDNRERAVHTEWLAAHDACRQQPLIATLDSEDPTATELLETLEDECWDLRCMSSPNADAGDYSIWWEVIEHRMSEPREVLIGRGETAIDALKDAINDGVAKEDAHYKAMGEDIIAAERGEQQPRDAGIELEAKP